MQVCNYVCILKCRYGVYTSHEEVCRYATKYVLKYRYGAYQVMKQYAGMQLGMYLNAGTKHIM
jgi:hypothetical protein